MAPGGWPAKFFRVRGGITLGIYDPALGNLPSLVDSNPNFTFGCHRGCHINKDRRGFPARSSKGDWVRTQATVDASKRSNLVAETPGIDKGKTYHLRPSSH